jgi:hypothetical protein
MKEFVIKRHEAFQLRVRTRKCLSPSNLNSLDFISECIDKDGNIESSSTYNFFMTDEEIKNLARELSK